MLTALEEAGTIAFAPLRRRRRRPCPGWRRVPWRKSRRAGDFQRAFHADLPMAGDGAEIGELARLRELEAQLHRTTLAVEVLRGHVEAFEHDVVLGAFAAADGDLDRVADVALEHRVHRALRIEVDHLAVRHAGLQHDFVDGAFCRLGRCGRRRLAGRLPGDRASADGADQRCRQEQHGNGERDGSEQTRHGTSLTFLVIAGEAPAGPTVFFSVGSTVGRGGATPIDAAQVKGVCRMTAIGR